MPDKKKPTETISTESVPLPKRPPKQLKTDYANLPQKPITLKRELQSPAALKKVAQKARRKPRTYSTPKTTPKTVPKEAVVPDISQWDFNGIAPAAREKALAAAAREGINPNEWLEKLILQGGPTENAPTESETAISESLKSIDERLDRLENQRGFWIRFWDRFMEQR